MGCEKIKNNALPGFNGWPISRISPVELRITAPPSTDGDRIDTFYHTLYCNPRQLPTPGRASYNQVRLIIVKSKPHWHNSAFDLLMTLPMVEKNRHLCTLPLTLLFFPGFMTGLI